MYLIYQHYLDIFQRLTGRHHTFSIRKYDPFRHVSMPVGDGFVVEMVVADGQYPTVSIRTLAVQIRLKGRQACATLAMLHRELGAFKLNELDRERLIKFGRDP